MIGGARKKSNNARNTRNGSAGPCGGGPSKKRHGRTTTTAATTTTTALGASVKAGVSSAAIRLENGEIRPLRDAEVGVLSERDEDEIDDNLSDDNHTVRPSSSHHHHRGRGHKNSKGSDPGDSSRGILHSSGGGAGGERGAGSMIIPPGHVGGPSKSTMDKDELNHIIPESKKFPQVSPPAHIGPENLKEPRQKKTS